MGKLAFGCCLAIAVGLALINGDEVCHTSDLGRMKVHVREFTTDIHDSMTNLKQELEVLSKQIKNQTYVIEKYKEETLALKKNMSDLENVQAMLKRLEDEVKANQNGMNINGSVCASYLLNGVEDSQLNASTEYCEFRDCVGLYSARYARLNATGFGTNSWLAGIEKKNQYVQVNFENEKTISGIALQGMGTLYKYVTKFKVLLSRDCIDFHIISDDTGADIIFDGNNDRNTIVIRHLPERRVAKCVRVNPVDWKHRIALRFDVIGC